MLRHKNIPTTKTRKCIINAKTSKITENTKQTIASKQTLKENAPINITSIVPKKHTMCNLKNKKMCETLTFVLILKKINSNTTICTRAIKI